MFKILFKISRPRFWFYLAGPFLIGAAATNSLEIFKEPWFYILFFYFLIFANVYLYGINDYFDNDTDKYNLKKEGKKESRLDNINSRRILLFYILFFIILSNLILIFLPTIESKLYLIIFLFLATFYSAPPLRFKKRRIIDSLSNILYIIPALVSFSLIAVDIKIDWFIITSAWSWAFAMHLFSAIPDIEPDKKAKLKTTAILFGQTNSLWLCFFFWLIFSLIIILKSYLIPLSFLFLIYPAIPLYLIIKKIPAEKIYWYFPYITSILGFFSFWYLIIF
ncbi:MAG: prenyltransferase [Candidatus Woesearchaeota archaeon]